MEPKMFIYQSGYATDFHLSGQHDQQTHGRGGGAGINVPDEHWSSFSEKGRTRAADIASGKIYKPWANARYNNELDSAEKWPERWIGEEERRSGMFAVPTFRSGKRDLKDPASYDEVMLEHNLAEITRKGKNGKTEYLSPDTDHLTARMKVIGLDKAVSPKELSRIVKEDKPVWRDSESSMNWTFYKIPQLQDVEIGVGLSDDGTIGTVIPGGYLTMAIQESNTHPNSKSQLGRLIMRKKVTQQVPSKETVRPTVPIEPVTLGDTVFKEPK